MGRGRGQGALGGRGRGQGALAPRLSGGRGGGKAFANFPERPSSSFSGHVPLPTLSFPSLPATWSVSPRAPPLACLPGRAAPGGRPQQRGDPHHAYSYPAGHLGCRPLERVAGFQSLQKWLGQGQPSRSKSTTYSAVQPESLTLYHVSSRTASEASSIAAGHGEFVPLGKI